MLHREKLLFPAMTDEERIVGAHALDKIESVLRGEEAAYTNFLDPHQQELVEGMVRQVPEVRYTFVGGFEQSERKRLVVIAEYMMWDVVRYPLAYLEIQGNFHFQEVSHRDYLGSLMGLGIKREMLGDIILLQDGGCQVVAAPEVKDLIRLQLTKVHQVPVEVREIGEEQLVLPEEKMKEITSTVASLRLDAVASAGFSMSRSQMVKIIKAGKVKVNFQAETDPACTIKPDDVISIRGRGRVEIKEITGETRKGRIKLTLNRYM